MKGNNLMLILITYLLNLLDYIFTRIFVSYGFVEMNPIMKFLMKHNADWFVKVVIIGMGCLFVWWHNDIKLARIGTWIVFIFYLILTIWWIINIVAYLIQGGK